MSLVDYLDKHPELTGDQVTDKAVSSMAASDRLVKQVTARAETVKHRKPVTETNTFKAATFLQAHQREEVTAADLARESSLSHKQASNVLQMLMTERTDVDRVAPGTYKYTPGKGPGIRQRKNADLQRGGPAVVRKPGPPVVQTALSPYASPDLETGAPGWVPSPADKGVLVKQPEMFYEIPGAKTRDGRRVIRGWDGVVYAIAELG